jgi:3-hydroxybutyryl-CoA dehydrogenase
MEVGTIMVAGAGLMGRGIAEVAACRGFKVIWSDVKSDLVRQGLSEIQQSFQRRVQKKKITPADHDRLLGLLQANVSVADGIERASEADMVIEAITENFQLKCDLHASLGKTCGPQTILVSNTSTFSITALGASSGRPDRFIGLHFFSPVPVMQVVEVIRGLLTSEQTCQAALAVVAKMGKEPVLAPDIPGFIVNRILLAWYNEAISLVAAGVKPQDIDRGWKLATNAVMGPLETADFSGLHVVLQALDSVYQATGDAKFKANPLLRNMVQAGMLGRKSGRGFYDYSKKQ